jgi:hypothetical protein
MIRLRSQQAPLQSHTQNSSVERPQNRHLKPFKSRAELNGQLDPRINPGGRPKIIGQTLTQRLLEEIESDIPDPKDLKKTITVKCRRLDLVVESLINNAMTYQPHSVSAFRTIREIVEPTQEEEQGAVDKDFTRLIAQLIMERPANAIEISSGSNANGEV